MKIGPFEILSTLGSGGSGIVYRAKNETLGRIVALKQLNRQVKEGDRIFERFKREAQLMASIHSDHVVTLYTYQIVDERPLLEMEYLEGGNLETLMASGPLDVPQVLRIVADILRGLKALHAAGIVHRDVKPANVLRDNNGRYKLTDFGLSVVESEIKTTFEAATIRWVAPESVAEPPTLDARSDLYAVGMIAYEAILGPDGFREAFPDLTPVAAFGEKWLGWLKNAQKDAPPLHVLRPGLSPSVSLFVARLMSKDPDRRFASADVALETLQLLLAEQPASASAEPERPRERVSAAGRRSNFASPPPQQPVAEDAVPEDIGAPVPNQSHLLRNIGIGVATLAVMITAVVLGAYVRRDAAPRKAVEPAPVSTQPLNSGLPPATDVAGGPRFVATFVDDKGAPVTDVDVKLRPGDLTATKNDKGEYVFAGLAPQSYEVTATKQGYAVAVKPVTVTASGGHETITLKPESGTDASIPSPNGNIPPPTGKTPGTATPPGTVKPGGGKPGRVNPTLASGCPAKPAHARDLFYCSPDSLRPANDRPDSQESAQTGLRYRVVQQLVNGRESVVDPSHAFRSGDRVRFAFQSNTDGYLYVVQQGSSGRWTMLFPSPQINGGKNAISAFDQYFVPDGGWFTFDQNAGTEHVFVVLSKDPIADLPGYDQRPVTQVQTLTQAKIDELSRSVRSRDLVLEDTLTSGTGDSVSDDSLGTFVVNKDESGDAVVANFELIHR